MKGYQVILSILFHTSFAVILFFVILGSSLYLVTQTNVIATTSLSKFFGVVLSFPASYYFTIILLWSGEIFNFLFIEMPHDHRCDNASNVYQNVNIVNIPNRHETISE